MSRSPVRRKLDPQATARNPAECATTEAQPVPRVAPAKLTARMMWMTEVVQDLHTRQLNLEAMISQAPAMRQLLRRMPRNLKALGPTTVPFDARLWARGDPAEGSRYATAVAWLRDHPGSSLRRAAQACGVNADGLRCTPARRELRLTCPSGMVWGGPTGGAQRALQYLKRHQPASVAEVARAVGVSSAALYHSVRFRKAWEAYARTAKLHPSARCLFGRRRTAVRATAPQPGTPGGRLIGSSADSAAAGGAEQAEEKGQEVER